jgi:hypothetical protein
MGHTTFYTELQPLKGTKHQFKIRAVVLGGEMVSMLATGPKVRHQPHVMLKIHVV